MTRIYILAFILSASFQAQAMKKRSCQGDLFDGPISGPVRPRPSVDYSYRNLPLAQKQIWSFEAATKSEQAEFVRRKLEAQLTVTSLQQPVATIRGHSLIPVNETSFLLLLKDPAGRKESAAYTFNERLGRPVKIPVTVKHVGGAAQVWLFNDHNDDILSAEEDLRLASAIQAHADLYLFNFLVSIAGAEKQNVVFDSDAGLIVSNFEDAFRYSMRHFAYHANPASPPKQAIENISIEDVAFILRSKLKDSKFDWVSALNGLDLENMNALTGQNLTNTETRDLHSRLCLLKAVLNKTNITNCPFP